MHDESKTMSTADGNPPSRDAIAGELLSRLMQRDLVFVMRFLGESQHLMQSHFQSFILSDLAALNQRGDPSL